MTRFRFIDPHGQYLGVIECELWGERWAALRAAGYGWENLTHTHRDRPLGLNLVADASIFNKLQCE